MTPNSVLLRNVVPREANRVPVEMRSGVAGLLMHPMTRAALPRDQHLLETLRPGKRLNTSSPNSDKTFLDVFPLDSITLTLSSH